MSWYIGFHKYKFHLATMNLNKEKIPFEVVFFS